VGVAAAGEERAQICQKHNSRRNTHKRFGGEWTHTKHTLRVQRSLLTPFSLCSLPSRFVQGEWALVTGATDGIGKAMCFELARRGLNVLLVSRSLTKLNEVADELSAKYPKVSTKVVAVDFSNFDSAAQGKVRAQIEQLEVGVLVNNVGMSYAHPAYFAELSHADVVSMIALNVTSTTIMTHLALPRMVERKRGAIVCISSAASQLPANPLLAQYAAAKAYVDKSVAQHARALAPRCVLVLLAAARAHPCLVHSSFRVGCS
jgi:17beta-estradiol 17-dehydrogenase / very-long-chain 3-oxoacyl-CoA reductase